MTVASRIGAPPLTLNNVMDEPIIQIQVYDKREKMTGNLYGVDLGDNRYRTTENDIFNCRLTLGAEFQTRVNDSGVHEIIRIVKDSPYVTRRFLKLSAIQVISDRLHS